LIWMSGLAGNRVEAYRAGIIAMVQYAFIGADLIRAKV